MCWRSRQELRHLNCRSWSELSVAALCACPHLDSEVAQLTIEYRKEEQLPTHQLLSKPLFIFTVILCNFPSNIVFKPAHSEYMWLLTLKKRWRLPGDFFPLPTCIITVKKINWWVGKQNKNHFEFLCSRHWYYIWVSTHRLQIPALIMQEDPRGGHVFAAALTCSLTFTHVQKFVESCYPGFFLRALFPSRPLLFVLIFNTAIQSVWFYHRFSITLKERHNSK